MESDKNAVPVANAPYDHSSPTMKWTQRIVIEVDGSEDGVSHQLEIEKFISEAYGRFGFVGLVQIKPHYPSVSQTIAELECRIKSSVSAAKTATEFPDRNIQSFSHNQCRKMFSDFIVRPDGEVQVCSVDVDNNVKIGNIFRDDLVHLIRRFNAVRASMINGMSIFSPVYCRLCTKRREVVDSVYEPIVGSIREEVQSRKDSVCGDAGYGCEPDKILAVVINSNSMEGAPSFGPPVGVVGNAEGEDEITNKLFEAREKGYMFGMVMRSGDEIVGDVAKSVTSNCFGKDILKVGSANGLRSVFIFRLSKLEKYYRGRPLLMQDWKGYAQRLARKEDIVLNDVALYPTASKIEAGRKVAVVFTHYRLPPDRLMKHLEWNREAYVSSGVKVFVVTDEDRSLPDFAQCLVFPTPLRVFNLAATSNYGIRYAIENGFDAVIKTDPDIVFSEEAWTQLYNVRPGSAVAPCYLMVRSYEERFGKNEAFPLATGTVSQAAEGWNRAHYHEGCVGYGCEDNVLLMAIERTGGIVDSIEGHPVWHIAHDENSPQVVERRRDTWNRGFNPLNLKNNMRFYNDPVYQNPEWGRGRVT